MAPEDIASQCHQQHLIEWDIKLLVRVMAKPEVDQRLAEHVQQRQLLFVTLLL